jgi:hypothetical protein
VRSRLCLTDLGKAALDQRRDRGVGFGDSGKDLPGSTGCLDIAEPDFQMALVLLAAADEGRVQRQGNRRDGGCRIERGGVAHRLAELQGAAAHAFVADPGIDRQKVPEHAGRDLIGHEGGQVGLEQIELRRRSAARWPLDSGLHRAATGTAETWQTDGDLAVRGGDLARAVILDLAHRRARPTARSPGGKLPALRCDDFLLDETRKLLALRQGDARSRDVARITSTHNLQHVDTAARTVDPGFDQAQN